MRDLIEREAAIEAVERVASAKSWKDRESQARLTVREIAEILRSLPSADAGERYKFSIGGGGGR